jgi:hypothetical protein
VANRDGESFAKVSLASQKSRCEVKAETDLTKRDVRKWAEKEKFNPSISGVYGKKKINEHSLLINCVPNG